MEFKQYNHVIFFLKLKRYEKLKVYCLNSKTSTKFWCSFLIIFINLISLNPVESPLRNKPNKAFTEYAQLH